MQVTSSNEAVEDVHFAISAAELEDNPVDCHIITSLDKFRMTLNCTESFMSIVHEPLQAICFEILLAEPNCLLDKTVIAAY